jgi:preprotein translocase subunit SecE
MKHTRSTRVCFVMAQLDACVDILYYASTSPRAVFFNETTIFSMNNFINYLRATRGEIKHVSWPTQRQTTIYTVLVILVSIATGLYLGGLDVVLTDMLGRILPS